MIEKIWIMNTRHQRQQNNNTIKYQFCFLYSSEIRQWRYWVTVGDRLFHGRRLLKCPRHDHCRRWRLQVSSGNNVRHTPELWWQVRWSLFMLTKERQHRQTAFHSLRWKQSVNIAQMRSEMIILLERENQSSTYVYDCLKSSWVADEADQQELRCRGRSTCSTGLRTGRRMLRIWRMTVKQLDMVLATWDCIKTWCYKYAIDVLTRPKNLSLLLYFASPWYTGFQIDRTNST